MVTIAMLLGQQAGMQFYNVCCNIMAGHLV